MSKISETINHRFTGNVKLIKSRHLAFAHHVQDVAHIPAREIALELKIHARGYVTDTSAFSKFDNTQEVLDSLKRSIVEEVYGEFRHYFIELNTAMYELDFDRMKLLLANMENQMFAR